MIKEVTMYTVECDRCKKTSGEDSEYAGWGDKDYAVEEAMSDDWIEHTDGKHYCPDCYTINDEDVITIK